MYSWFQVACPHCGKRRTKLTNQIRCTWWHFGIACIWLVRLDFSFSAMGQATWNWLYVRTSVCECKFIKCAECAHARITLKYVQSISDAITFLQPQGQSRVFSCPLCILCCMPACYMCVYECVYKFKSQPFDAHKLVVFALIDFIQVMNVPFIQWTRKGTLISVLMKQLQLLLSGCSQ